MLTDSLPNADKPNSFDNIGPKFHQLEFEMSPKVTGYFLKSPTFSRYTEEYSTFREQMIEETRARIKMNAQNKS